MRVTDLGKPFLSLAVMLLACGASAADESVETAALAWFKDVYAKAFVEGHEDFLDHYAEPMHFVIGSDIRVLDREALGAVIDEVYVQPLAAEGWTTSALISVDVEALGPHSARFTAAWALLDDSGRNVIGCEAPEWHYVVVHNGERWQVITEVEGGCPD
jgi:hypothetical protein